MLPACRSSRGGLCWDARRQVGFGALFGDWSREKRRFRAIGQKRLVSALDAEEQTDGCGIDS